jgi:hypothetical protein
MELSDQYYFVAYVMQQPTAFTVHNAMKINHFMVTGLWGWNSFGIFGYYQQLISLNNISTPQKMF